MRKSITVKFNFEEKVFLKTDPDRKMRIVSGYIVRRSGIQYGLGCNDEESFHQDIEIESFKNKIFRVKGFSG